MQSVGVAGVEAACLFSLLVDSCETIVVIKFDVVEAVLMLARAVSISSSFWEIVLFNASAAA